MVIVHGPRDETLPPPRTLCTPIFSVRGISQPLPKKVIAKIRTLLGVMAPEMSFGAKKILATLLSLTLPISKSISARHMTLVAK